MRLHSFLSEIANENLYRLQNFIARGENTQAVKMAALFPHLLEKRAGVTDYSHRKFMPLFPLQLAAYYQNTRLCEALCEYLPEKTAMEQLCTHDAQGVYYTRYDNPGMYLSEKYFSEEDLLTSLEQLIMHYKQPPEIKNRALIDFRNEQLMMPPHTAMWYCAGQDSIQEPSETSLQIRFIQAKRKPSFYAIPEGYAAFGVSFGVCQPAFSGAHNNPPRDLIQRDLDYLKTLFYDRRFIYREFYALRSGVDPKTPINHDELGVSAKR